MASDGRTAALLADRPVLLVPVRQAAQSEVISSCRRPGLRHLRLWAAGDVLPTAGSLVHALPDIGRLTGSCGLSLCGRLSGEEIRLLAGQEWSGVPAAERCPACADLVRAGSGQSLR
jgi:hypothetical protein